MKERRLLTPSWRYLPLKFAFAMELAEICDIGDEMKEEVQTSQVDFSTEKTSLGNLIIATERTGTEALDLYLK